MAAPNKEVTAQGLSWHHLSHRPQSLIATAAPATTSRMPRRGMERLDLLLLAIEALDLHGSEAMVWSCEQLQLQEAFPIGWPSGNPVPQSTAPRQPPR